MRFEDGVAYYRKAIAADPQLDAARSQLGINLMRMGQEDEARQQLETCYNDGYRDGATVNSLRLLDSYKELCHFQGCHHDPHAPEERSRFAAALLRRGAEAGDGDLPAEVQDTRCRDRSRSKSIPTTRILPCGRRECPGLGALGVTFGQVVAMDSPSARNRATSIGPARLWHEMSHVYILALTNHRVPRWFTEGLAVHEETAGLAGVGRPHHPRHRRRARGQETAAGRRSRPRFCPPGLSGAGHRLLLPGGPHLRLHPGPLERRQASRYGACLRELKTTPEVIQQVLGISPEEFDKQFQAWLYQQDGGPALTSTSGAQN